MLGAVADQLEQRGLGRVLGEGGLDLLLDGGGAEIERLEDVLGLGD